MLSPAHVDNVLRASLDERGGSRNVGVARTFHPGGAAPGALPPGMVQKSHRVGPSRRTYHHLLQLPNYEEGQGLADHLPAMAMNPGMLPGAILNGPMKPGTSQADRRNALGGLGLVSSPFLAAIAAQAGRPRRDGPLSIRSIRNPSRNSGHR